MHLQRCKGEAEYEKSFIFSFSNGFMFFFKYLISGSILNGLMLVWRFVSYYFGMIVGAIALAVYRKKEQK